jgi:hypothetical protein
VPEIKRPGRDTYRLPPSNFSVAGGGKALLFTHKMTVGEDGEILSRIFPGTYCVNDDVTSLLINRLIN